MSEMTEQEARLVGHLAEMEEDEGIDLAKKMLLEEGADPMRVLELCRAAMDIVGKKFEDGEYFLPELVLAGEMLDTIGAIAKPLIKNAPGEEPRKLGKVLIGTVHGDLHDIGKNIVSFMLDINGFEVRTSASTCRRRPSSLRSRRSSPMSSASPAFSRLPSTP